MQKIQMFDGEYAFLSNFYKCPVTFKGRTFTSSEAAYHAEKCAKELDKDNFVGIDPDASKKLGRKIDLRTDWEDVKEQIMFEIVTAKFDQNPELAAKLLETGDAYLMEGNWWRDQFWGVYPETGNPGVDGLNVLGQILMRVRANLKYEYSKGRDYICQ